MVLLVFFSFLAMIVLLILFWVYERANSRQDLSGYVAEPTLTESSALLPLASGETTVTTVGELCRKLKIFVTTWNMGDTTPGDTNLAPLFQPIKIQDNDWDIIVVGTQECNFKPRVGFLTCEADWVDRINRAVASSCPNSTYITMEQMSLRDSIRMVILVKQELRPHISNLKISTFSTTVPLFWRKGAVGCSMTLFDFTSVCFINCHLAAHQESTAARNDECKQILRELRLGNINYDAGNQFSHCFFFGDLNYRLDTTWHDAVAYLNRNEYGYLHHRDQLFTEQRRGNALALFQEPGGQPPLFPPTFKVKRGTTNVYDQKRTPSWCDRILWKSLPDCVGNMTSLTYESNERVLTSDHLSVMAAFEMTLPLLNTIVPLWPQHVFSFILTDIEITVDLTRPKPQQLLQIMSPTSSRSSSIPDKLNPRLIVSGPLLAVEPIKSAPVQNVTSTATWTELPPFSSKQIPKDKYISYQHLFIAVYDYKWEGREELFAQAAISLRPHVGSKMQFQSPLLYGGAKRGTITGYLLVQ